MLALVEHAPFSPQVKERAAGAFRLLAEAEAKVHGARPEEVHFHEVSGLDTVLDVFGTCLAFEALGIARATCSPVAVGSGTIRCAHGILPSPAPATLEILARRGIPCRQLPVEHELLTPTGAALLAVLVDSFGPAPTMTPKRVGCGAGGRELPGLPNLLRAVLGETEEAAGRDRVREWRFVVDDMTAQEIAALCESAFAAGAVEAYAIAATMKKSRPGAEVTVLAFPDRAAAVEAALWRHASTFGMRTAETERVVLDREIRTVEVRGRPVRIKLGRRGGEILRRRPEYEDCLAVARACGATLGEIQREAEAADRA